MFYIKYYLFHDVIGIINSIIFKFKTININIYIYIYIYILNYFITLISKAFLTKYIKLFFSTSISITVLTKHLFFQTNLN
jgi:hypothetical protein